MIQNKMTLVLLLGFAFLFAACQAPVEPTTPSTTETPGIELPEETPPLLTAQATTVNGHEISAEQITQTQQRLSQVSGQQVTIQQATQYLIEEHLLLQEARDRGLEPTTQEVEAAMEQQLAMQNVTLEEFKETMSEAEYQQLVIQQQNQISIQALQLSLAPTPTEEEIAEVYEENRELFEEEGISEEEAREDIIAFLAQTQGQEALAALLEELYQNADIQ